MGVKHVVIQVLCDFDPYTPQVRAEAGWVTHQAVDRK
jgi:hypothetical protein